MEWIFSYLVKRNLKRRKGVKEKKKKENCIFATHSQHYNITIENRKTEKVLLYKYI